MTTFGIKTSPQHTTWEGIVSVWKEADEIDVFSHAWLFDHFAPAQGDIDGPCFEGWTALGALAHITRRLRLGLMVTGNTYRHPAVLAKIATTVDVMSQGRLDFGIGAGWNVYEHESMGIPLLPPAARLAQFEEACEIWKRLFTEHLTTFDGVHYQLHEARNEPKPIQQPHPPFVIGGGGEKKTLRIVAKYADIWNHNGNLEDFQRKVTILHRYCDDIGRDPSEITLSVQQWLKPDEYRSTVESSRRFQEAGATHFVFVVPPPHKPGVADKVAENLVLKIQHTL